MKCGLVVLVVDLDYLWHKGKLIAVDYMLPGKPQSDRAVVGNCLTTLRLEISYKLRKI